MTNFYVLFLLHLPDSCTIRQLLPPRGNSESDSMRHSHPLATPQKIQKNF